MGVIVVDQAKPEAACKVCGEPARTHIHFQGPGADRRAKLDLCPRCGRLLGHLLIEREPVVKH